MLKLCHRRERLHGHFSGRAGEVHTAQRQTLNPNFITCQQFNCLSDVHGIASEGIKTGDNQRLAIFHAVSSLVKPGRSLAATEPLIFSSISRWELMAKQLALLESALQKSREIYSLFDISIGYLSKNLLYPDAGLLKSC